MSIRYIYNLGLALLAGFLVVATQVFSSVTASWLTFAVAIAAAAAALGIIPARIGTLQRVLASVTVVIGGWTIVASLLFAPTTAVWLGLASAAVLLALALAGLTAHEVSTERVVHSIEVDSAAQEGAAA